MLPWTVVYKARPVLAALQTSHRRRRDAAAVTPRESQYNLVQYKLAVLTYKVLNGEAPRYLGPLVRVNDLPARRTVRSASSNRLVAASVKPSTVDSRAFAVAAPNISNPLPNDVISADSLLTFRRLLKRFFLSR